MIRVGIIGIGGTGANIAHLAKGKHGVKTFNINTNRGDIKDLSSPVEIIGDKMGVAQCRDTAKEILSEDVLKNIKTSILKHFQEHDIVFCIGSLAGGTGSGMIPVVTKMLNEGDNNKTMYIPVAGVAGIADSPKELRNSGAALKELWNTRKYSFLIWKNSDNHNKINTLVVDKLFGIFSPREAITKTIDPQEIKTLFSTSGMTSIKNINAKNEILDNIFLDDEQVKRVGIWADNIEFPDSSRYKGSQIFRGRFTGELKGITLLEAGHTLPVSHLKNMMAVIEEKESGLKLGEDTAADKEATKELESMGF
jgi:hypothetical protein